MAADKPKPGAIRRARKPRTAARGSEAGALPQADDKRYRAMRTRLLKDLQPRGPLETALAERVALQFWRLEHHALHDVALMEAARRPGHGSDERLRSLSGLAKELEQRGRREEAMQQHLHTLLGALQRLQQLRLDHAVSEPDSEPPQPARARRGTPAPPRPSRLSLRLLLDERFRLDTGRLRITRDNGHNGARGERPPLLV